VSGRACTVRKIVSIDLKQKKRLKRIIKTSHLGPTMSGNNNKLTIYRTHLSLFGVQKELGEVLHMRKGVD
jgi:hypothetical protein